MRWEIFDRPRAIAATAYRNDRRHRRTATMFLFIQVIGNRKALLADEVQFDDAPGLSSEGPFPAARELGCLWGPCRKSFPSDPRSTVTTLPLQEPTGAAAWPCALADATSPNRLVPIMTGLDRQSIAYSKQV